MKSILISILLCSICIFATNGSDDFNEDLLQNLKKEFVKNGFPKLSYYDAAQLADELQTLYQSIVTKLKSVKLERSTFTDFNKELFFKNGLELIKALQIFYTKSLDAFDNGLEVIVNLRKEQKDGNLVTGEAFVNMYKAIMNMDAGNDETFIGALLELVTTLGKLNKDAVKVMFQLAKKHKDLQPLMEVHEDGTQGLQTICRKFAKISSMSTDIGESVAEVLEPVVTLMFLGTLFG